MTSSPSNDIRILITNDDGYSADGIKILEEISKSFTDDVWIVAPEFEKSGASHALSFTKELALKSQGEKIFSINGNTDVPIIHDFFSMLKNGFQSKTYGLELLSSFGNAPNEELES